MPYGKLQPASLPVNYDALGRRVFRTVNGGTTQFVHDGDTIALELQGGVVTAVYRYGNQLVARNGEVVLPDGLGSTRQTVDASQVVTSTLTTEAFGAVVSQSGSSGNPYRFAGAWGYCDDGDAGLLHVGARYYDPQVGRFIRRDPVLSEHPYLYCQHEPVNRVDPSGRIKINVTLGPIKIEAEVDVGKVIDWLFGEREGTTLVPPDWNPVPWPSRWDEFWNNVGNWANYLWDRLRSIKLPPIRIPPEMSAPVFFIYDPDNPNWPLPPPPPGTQC